MPPLSSTDLDHVLEHTRPLWEELRGQRLFITGGTGFFGCWLLESFAWANQRLDLNASVTVLSRNPAAFARKAPHLAGNPAIQFIVGDVGDFGFPDGNFSHVLHAATDAVKKIVEEQPLAMLDSIVNGTRRTLDFAVHCGAKKYLLTSSGAVYGKQPSDTTHVPEDYNGGPDLTHWRSSYSEGKRMAELLCLVYHKTYGLDTKIARCFAFVGPHLPLDTHFAVGNFLRDAMAGAPIQIGGDGTPYRSYLYAADLAIWLWTILFKGETARPYNVGSARDVPMAELARIVAGRFSPPPPVRIAKTPEPGQGRERYVPSVDRAETELGLHTWVGLEDALARTIFWHRSSNA